MKASVWYYIGGLEQERCNSIANALEFVFLASAHGYVGKLISMSIHFTTTGMNRSICQL